MTGGAGEASAGTRDGEAGMIVAALIFVLALAPLPGAWKLWRTGEGRSMAADAPLQSDERPSGISRASLDLSSDFCLPANGDYLDSVCRVANPVSAGV